MFDTSDMPNMSDSTIPQAPSADNAAETTDVAHNSIWEKLTPEQRSDLALKYAVAIIGIVHRSVDWSVWGTKRLTYWDTLQGAITASAYTNSLTRFLERIADRMGIPLLGNNARERRFLYNAVGWSDPHLEAEILRVLRTETRFIVLSVRVQQENRKQARVVQEEDVTEDAARDTRRNAQTTRRRAPDLDTMSLLQAALFGEEADDVAMSGSTGGEHDNDSEDTQSEEVD